MQIWIRLLGGASGNRPQLPLSLADQQSHAQFVPRRKEDMHQPLVAVSTDVRQFDNYTWHATPQQYIEAAITTSGVFPLLVPSFGDRIDLDRLLASVDGVMVTGSKSNVHPSLYGGDASEANGPYDPARDATTLP